jgi:phosphomethylpyrimidine synthase
MTCRTQMHHARQGSITPEMRRVAEREGLPPETIRDEVAIGRLIIPANVNHLAQRLDPMAIGKVASVKINANIGNSAVESNIDGELEKLHHAVHYGADTVMDLSTGGNIDAIREAIIAASPVPIGTVPIYQAIENASDVSQLTVDHIFDNIEHQARQGVDYVTVHAGILREHVDDAARQAEPAVRALRPVARDRPRIRCDTVAGRRAPPRVDRRRDGQSATGRTYGPG